VGSLILRHLLEKFLTKGCLQKNSPPNVAGKTEETMIREFIVVVQKDHHI
jgi:hypothetical protein